MNPNPTPVLGKKILLIDDEEAIREVLEHALSLEGFNVQTATNGDEAIVLARKQHFDLVITDMIMPGMEGIEAIMKLRGLMPKIKIIAMSGGQAAGTGDFLPLAKTLGATAVLHKPFDCETLFAAVELALTPLRRPEVA